MRGVVPIAGGVLLYFAMPVCADEAPSFAKDVAPIFATNCAGCHASNVAMGTLDLDTFAGIQKGGHSGPVIAPGKSGESFLYLRITGAVTPAMPLNGKKLADGEIEIIRKWIDGGAKPPAPGEVVAKGAAAIPDIKPRTAVKPLISALAFRFDGKLLALGTFKEVRLVEPETGKIVATLPGEAEDVRAVAFSPDGKLCPSSWQQRPAGGADPIRQQPWQHPAGQHRAERQQHGDLVCLADRRQLDGEDRCGHRGYRGGDNDLRHPVHAGDVPDDGGQQREPGERQADQVELREEGQAVVPLAVGAEEQQQRLPQRPDVTRQLRPGDEQLLRKWEQVEATERADRLLCTGRQQD